MISKIYNVVFGFTFLLRFFSDMSTMLMATSIFFACMPSIRAWSLTDDILEMVPGKERQETEILIIVA